MHPSSACPAALATSSAPMGHSTPFSMPAPFNNFQQPQAGRMSPTLSPWPTPASMPASNGPPSPSHSGNRPQSGFLRTRPALESDTERLSDAEPDATTAHGPGLAPRDAQHGARWQAPPGPFQQGVPGQALPGQHAQQQGSGSLGTGTSRCFLHPQHPHAIAAYKPGCTIGLTGCSGAT